ncbi:YHS domain-containing (seleno)protein [Marinobacter sp.]|uniref:YHS domain-containing (seleno)protein n=1 Tax=Marinobacter sp. TaxID=50741 RepID=UPI003B51620C
MIAHRMQVHSALVLILFLLLAVNAHAADHEIAAQGQPALEGYSPVSYFEQGQPERGSRNFQSTFQGNLYWFTSAEQKKRFDAAPSAYAPTFPRSCPYNLAQGRLETVDPTSFKIVDGQLLLFHSSPEQDGRQKWEDSIVNTEITEKELLRRAKSNIINLKF